MKRKHNLIDNSDNEETLSETKEPKIKRDLAKKEPGGPSNLRRILKYNAILATIFLVPFLAIKFCHQGDVQLGSLIDNFIGERCSSPIWVHKNISLLRKNLEDNFFGQHIAQSIILSQLSRRWTTSTHIGYQKPLVMSFHGWTGSGKVRIYSISQKQLTLFILIFLLFFIRTI